MKKIIVWCLLALSLTSPSALFSHEHDNQQESCEELDEFDMMTFEEPIPQKPSICRLIIPHKLEVEGRRFGVKILFAYAACYQKIAVLLVACKQKFLALCSWNQQL